MIVVFGPCRALRGEGTISKMCLQLNILDSILTVGLQHLSGAQLSGAQLSGAKLSGAQLSGAQLSGAQFTGAQSP